MYLILLFLFVVVLLHAYGFSTGWEKTDYRGYAIYLAFLLFIVVNSASFLAGTMSIFFPLVSLLFFSLETFRLFFRARRMRRNSLTREGETC